MDGELSIRFYEGEEIIPRLGGKQGAVKADKKQ
jgi:hypothetical protein